MGDSESGSDDGDAPASAEEPLREDVEAKYDFDDFGPEEMAEMTLPEWEAAFDPDTWITGPELLDRVERDLRSRIAARDVFAVVERDRRSNVESGVDAAHADEDVLVAYSEEDYAVVYEDGSVGGRGTVLRDVKPSVALCSMDDYEVPTPPADADLPRPGEVPEGSGDLGNKLLQAVGAVQVLAGAALLVAWVAAELAIVAAIIALAFLAFGVFILVVVANARLSDRFRSEEYRDRLRSAGVDSGERPGFVPGAEEESGEGTESRTPE